MIGLSCIKCGKTVEVKQTRRGNCRAPAGWKRLQEKHYCGSCWKSCFILRTISIPITGPIGATWPELGQALKASWAQCTNLANWAVTELAKGEAARDPEQERLPSMPQVYLYPEARRRFPDLPSKSVAALLHSVDQRYRKARLAVIWRCEASLPRYRFPMPIPVNNQGWRAELLDGKVPAITLRLLDKEFTLRLRSGKHFSRQVRSFALLVSKKAVQGELAISRRRASYGDHRAGIENREPGGGNRAPFRIIANMAAWFPRVTETKERAGILKLETAHDSFLVATSGQSWVLNANHVRRWNKQYAVRLHRLAQDCAFETRRNKRAMIQIADYRRKVCEKHSRRLKTFAHQAAAAIAGYANRLNVSEVQLLCRIKSYFQSFCWEIFYSTLEAKLTEKGIRLAIDKGIVIEATAV